MDDHSITPRRALPPVPPPGRQSGTATLAPAVDQTSWFDPLDPMNDSAVHAAFTGLDPLDDGTAAKAARDLIRESGRQPVLDQALLEALDAAAKAAEARRAVTFAVPPTTAAAPAVVAPPAPAAVPVAPAAPAQPTLDISAEFARHDDLTETARHAAPDEGWMSAAEARPPATDTGRHLAPEVDVDTAPHTHRTVVTRPSGRRWIPAGVGLGVVTIVGAVMLTSGFGSDGSPVSTDEAARTGTSTTEPAPPPTGAPPGANTIDLTVPVVVEEDPSRAPSPTAYTPTVVQPQVATPPTAGSISPPPTTPGPSSQPGTPPGAVVEDPAATLHESIPVLDPELSDPAASTASTQADSSVPTT